MKFTLLVRYLYKNRYSYIATLFIYIAAFSCGISSSCAIYKYSEGSVLMFTLLKLLLWRLLPVVMVLLGGLFFAGSVIAVGAECYFAYKLGFAVGSQFMVSFFSGIAYAFLCGIPMNLIYLVLMTFAFVCALDCNIFRMAIRVKGLKRPMTMYEVRQYIGKALVVIGAVIIAVFLENYIFARGYVNLVT